MTTISLDIQHPELRDIFDPSSDITAISTGHRFLEGPVWHPQKKSLLFSDILANATLQWSNSEGLSIYRANSHMANGNTLDRQGRLISCHHASSRVTRMEDEQTMTVLASHYQGKELNSPNDVVVKSDGSVYFTDPPFGREAKVGIPRDCELDVNGVYRYDPDSDALTLLTSALNRPNGLCFSLDESLLYINDSPEYTIHVFDASAEGRLSNQRLFATTVGGEPGVPDGMKIDSQGNLYCCAQGGLQVFKPDGALLGRLLTPMQITNFAWGDDDLRSIYLTGLTTLYRVRSDIPGLPLC